MSDYEHLPISPTKIETKTERKKRISCMKHHLHKSSHRSPLTALAEIGGIPRPYITLSSERVFDKVLDRQFDEYRASYVAQLRQFKTKMLRELHSDDNALDKAYSDLYKQVASPASQLIDFAIRKLVKPCQSVNWTLLPHVYKTDFGLFYNHDIMHHGALINSECPVLRVFSLIND